MIAVASAFRNMSGRLERYFRQVSSLSGYLKVPVRVVAVEGDSTDDTHDQLFVVAERWGVPIEVRTHNHGYPPFSSTESPIRMAALTGVYNEALRGVTEDDDYLLYVESDLIWEPLAVKQLLEIVKNEEFDVVAPMIMANGFFYDVWAYRKDGERFGPMPPYHAGLDGHTLIESAGSCLVMKAEVARKVANPGPEALVSWCGAVREAGYRIGVAPEVTVEHPV